MKIANWSTGDTDECIIYGTHWQAQTFPTGCQDWILTYIRLKTKKIGSPTYPFIFSIRNVGADGKPTGTDLCSGSTDPSIWPASATWKDLYFESTVKLTANTQFAIVIRSPDSTISNAPMMRHDAVDPTYYPAGLDFDSYDSGNTWLPWSPVSTASAMFEVYGQPIETSMFITLMDTFRRGFKGNSNFEVTRSALSFGDRDATTGWYAKNYTDSTIKMMLIPKEASKMALQLGYWVSLDALGLTADAVDVYDLIKDKFDRTWEVKTVKPVIVGDAVRHFACDLKELPLHA